RRYTPSRSEAQPSDLIARQIRMRAVARLVGRLMTSWSQQGLLSTIPHGSKRIDLYVLRTVVRANVAYRVQTPAFGGTSADNLGGDAGHSAVGRDCGHDNATRPDLAHAADLHVSQDLRARTQHDPSPDLGMPVTSFVASAP